MKVLDIHTHLQLNLPGVPHNPHRAKMPPLLIRLYELMGYKFLFWKEGNYPEPMRLLISLDNQLRISMASRDNLIRYMNSTGVDISVVMPISPFVTSREYLQTIEGEKRLLTFASAHPSDSQWRENLHRDMEDGCRGVKIHPILQQLHPQDEFYFNLLEEFQKYNKPVLTHTGEFEYFIPRNPYSIYGKVNYFEKLVAAFPQVPIILGHMGTFDPWSAIELARRYENVYLETSFQPVSIIRKAINEVGSHRVLFGSDWPESGQKAPLQIAQKAAGKDKTLAERLLWKNAIDLIGPID